MATYFPSARAAVAGSFPRARSSSSCAARHAAASVIRTTPDGSGRATPPAADTSCGALCANAMLAGRSSRMRRLPGRARSSARCASSRPSTSRARPSSTAHGHSARQSERLSMTTNERAAHSESCFAALAAVTVGGTRCRSSRCPASASAARSRQERSAGLTTAAGAVG